MTDLRFFQPDQRTPWPAVVESLRRRFRRGVRVWIMFGLARAYTAGNDDAERHWLQVNGLCLEDAPLGPEP